MYWGGVACVFADVEFCIILVLLWMGVCGYYLCTAGNSALQGAHRSSWTSMYVLRQTTRTVLKVWRMLSAMFVMHSTILEDVFLSGLFFGVSFLQIYITVLLTAICIAVSVRKKQKKKEEN